MQIYELEQEWVTGLSLVDKPGAHLPLRGFLLANASRSCSILWAEHII